MIKVENREIKPYNTHYGIPKMIFYFDSLECNHCRIEHLLDYHIIYKTTENAPEFDVMIIFSPRQDDYDSVSMGNSGSKIILFHLTDVSTAFFWTVPAIPFL